MNWDGDDAMGADDVAVMTWRGMQSKISYVQSKQADSIGDGGLNHGLYGIAY